MSYTEKYKVLDIKEPVSLVTNGVMSTVRYQASGTFNIRFPGKIFISKLASYSFHTFVKDPPLPDGQVVTSGKWNTRVINIPLTVEIKTPDGKPFTADHVTLNELKQFRDLRGISQGTWSYNIHGDSVPRRLIPGFTRVTVGQAHTQLWVEELIISKSASPLISDTLSTPGNHRYTFDLYRVGTFTASVKANNLTFPAATPRKMKLYDPDGVVVATGNNGKLTYPVTLRTLNKSRDVKGNVRTWTLEVLPSTGAFGSREVAVNATVITTSRIQTSVLNDRINTLLGEHGSKLSIYGEMKESSLLARLKILDVITAEIIDMHGLLDDIIKSKPQDDGINVADLDIQKGTAYTLASISRNFDYGCKIALHDCKIKTIDISIGTSEQILPAIPAVKLLIRTQGHVTVTIGGFPLATIKVRDNNINMEAGLRLNPDGSFSAETWIDHSFLDIDLHWAAALEAGVIGGGLLLFGLEAFIELIERSFNKAVLQGFTSILSGAMEKAPKILAMIHGDLFTYKSMRLEGDNIIIDYIAPLEPEPKPQKGYHGVIGRGATQLGPELWQFMPRSTGDTWKADSLNKNIDHIVVVMMENRSFDHVLGYRAQLPGHEDSDGLSVDLTKFLMDIGYSADKLSASGIIENAAGLKTKFPASVGHSFDDVAEQLSKKLTLPNSQRLINSPEGFISNFYTDNVKKYSTELKDTDVLGYYDAKDLPFFNYLAENYAYSEKFFCSHPGPTLPNRMFSLTGDLQINRTGERIINNNHGGDVSLSRAMTIYDLLSKKGISWRVYESFPSVTMLRMFARYATDTTNIINIARMKQDVSEGNLPALTIVEPAMHHYPENDDHSPDADMYDGQVFLQDVYNTLRSNDSIWRKTMLIITYDEHGGFYDHVIPPIADIRTRENSTPRTTAPVAHPFSSIDPGRPQTGNNLISPSLVTNYGVRVPTFVVSPWVTPGKGPDIVLDFCSILKTVIARFCGEERPFLSDRVEASRTFEAFLSEALPRMDVPAFPGMNPLPLEPQPDNRAIRTMPISRRQMRSGNIDYHALSGMIARMLGR